MARRTRTERIVEREQPRLRILVSDPASPALEPLGEQVDPRLADSPSRTTRRPKPRRRLRGRPSRSNRSAAGADLHRQAARGRPPPAERCAIGKRRRIDIVERDGAAVHQQARETLLAQSVDRRRHRSGGRGSSRELGRWRSPQSLLLPRCRPTAPPARRPPVRVRRQRSSRRPASRSRAAAASLTATAPAGWRRLRPFHGRLRGRSFGSMSGRRGRTAAACSRGSPSSCRRSSAGCGRCSSAGWRSRARCRRCDRRPASPSARETGGRTPTAIRRTAAVPRRRSYRRPMTTFPSR